MKMGIVVLSDPHLRDSRAGRGKSPGTAESLAAVCKSLLWIPLAVCRGENSLTSLSLSFLVAASHEESLR